MNEKPQKPLPKPLYGCRFCAEEYSWPAEDLFWSEAHQGWVCDYCWDEKDSGDRGGSLFDELQQRGLSR